MFLYFLPAATTTPPKPETILAAGLGYAFESRPHIAGVERGPAGHKGVVLGDKQRCELGAVKYLPDPQVQEWRKAPGASYWVGRYVGQTIRPDDLQRQFMLDGYLVELADGHKWVIPKAREFFPSDDCTPEQFRVVYTHKLPQVMQQDENGDWSELEQPLPRYQALWDLCRSWNELQRGNPTPEDFDRWGNLNHYLNSAVTAIAANYALGSTEASMLGLLTREHAREVLNQVIDTPGFERLKKKWKEETERRIAAEPGSTSPAGHEDERPPAIAPPSPT